MPNGVQIIGRSEEGPAEVRGETGVLYGGEAEELSVMQGKAFTVEYKGTAMAVAAEYNILIYNNSNNILIRMEITPSAAFEAWFYEDCVVSNEGTALNVVSLNRVCASVGNTNVFLNPVVTDQGVLLLNPVGFEGGNKSPGVSVTPSVIMLACKKKYLLKVKNTDGNDADIQARLVVRELHKKDAKYYSHDTKVF